MCLPASRLPFWPGGVQFARCASCCSSVARGNCVCRSGSLPCRTVRRRRSSGKWPPWCCHDSHAPATSCTGKTSRLYTRGGWCLFLNCLNRFIYLFRDKTPRFSYSSYTCFEYNLYLLYFYQLKIITLSLFPQVCKPVFLLGYRKPGEWAVSLGGYPSLRGTAGQIFWQCISSWFTLFHYIYI